MPHAAHPPAVDFLFVGRAIEPFERDLALLRKAGFTNLEFAQGALAARRLLKARPVHFVLAELDLPHVTGIDLLKLIRRTPAFMAVPFLLISDQRQKDLVRYAIDEEADGFLVSPYSGEELLCNILRVERGRAHWSALHHKLLQAKKALLEHRLAEAIAQARAILTASPDHAGALLILAEGLFLQGELDKARLAVAPVLRQDPCHGKALHLLSKICRQAAGSGEAFTHLSSAIDKHPLNPDLRIDLGKLYLGMDLDAKAKEIFDAILADSPSDLSLVKIGKAYLKKGHLDVAGQFLNAAEQPLPETVFVFEKYADALAEAGRHEESAGQYEKCLRLRPRQVGSLQKLVDALLNLGKKDEAKERCALFLQDQPDDPEARALAASLGVKT